MYEQFRIMEVDKDNDNVRMSDFIKDQNNSLFENGKAFYEFTGNKEDLLYYKEVVHISQQKLQQGDTTVCNIIISITYNII